MRIAVVQIQTNQTRKANIEQALMCVVQAAKKGAELVCFPEMVFGRQAGGGRNGMVIHGREVQRFRDQAKHLKVGIVLGSIEEARSQDKKFYNTMVAISDTGKILAVYRKKHLFKALIGTRRIDETCVFACGHRRASFLFKGLRFGCGICYDVRFPDMFQAYARERCDVILLPSAFTFQTGRVDWEVLVRARAIETRAFVLAPNKYGKNADGVKLYGNSMIVDPQGTVIKRARVDKKSILYAEITRTKR